MSDQNDLPTSELISHIQAAIGLIDAHDKLTQVNPYLARLVGYATEDMIGKPIVAFINPGQHTFFSTKA